MRGARNFRLSFEVTSIGRRVLRERDSGKVIRVATSRANVTAVVREYRGFLDQAQRELAQASIRCSATTGETLRSVWSDALAENRKWPAGHVN
jgi:hypothetical protein